MTMHRGEIWWAALPAPAGSGPGFRRPVLIVQSDEFNQSAIRTVLCAVLTSNARLAAAPGNVLLARRISRLPNVSVVNVSQLITIDKRFLSDRVSCLPAARLREVEAGLKLVQGLSRKAESPLGRAQAAATPRSFSTAASNTDSTTPSAA